MRERKRRGPRCRRVGAKAAMTEEKIEAAINDAHCLLAQNNMTSRALGLEELAQQHEKKRFKIIARELLSDDWVADTDEWRDWLVGSALSGSRPAHEALRHAAKSLLYDDKSVPPWLGWYLLDAARKGGVQHRAKRGRKKVTSRRNIAISWAIYIIALRYNLKPTRNTGTSTECGCSIVAKALKRYDIILKESNVAAIWRSSRRQIEEDWQGPGKAPPLEADPSFKLQLPVPEPTRKWVTSRTRAHWRSRLSRSRRGRRLYPPLHRREQYEHLFLRSINGVPARYRAQRLKDAQLLEAPISSAEQPNPA